MGTGKGGTGVNAGISGGISLQGSHDETTRNAEVQNVIENISEKYDVHNALKKTENDAIEDRYSMMDSEGKSFDSGIRANLDEAFSQQKSAQASFSQEKSYREAAQLASNQGIDSTQNLSNEILRKEIEQHGFEGGVKNVSDTDSLNAVRKAFIDSKEPQLKQEFDTNKTNVTAEQLEAQYREDSSTLQANNNAEERYEKNQEHIFEMAKKENLTEEVTSPLPVQVNHTMQKAEELIQKKQKEFLEKKNKLYAEHEQFKKNNTADDSESEAKKILRTILEDPRYHDLI